MFTTALAIDAIRRDGGTQVRASLDSDHVDALAEHARAGGAFSDPVIVFYDGTHYWLADGFHRVTACERAGVPNVAADVRSGTQRDAQLFACGANAQHTGLRRTNADKRRAVEMLLRDVEWAKWSDREIARRCGVGAPMVAPLRAICNPITDAPRTVERNGTTYTMNTSGIGRGAKPASEPAAQQSIPSASAHSAPLIEEDDDIADALTAPIEPDEPEDPIIEPTPQPTEAPRVDSHTLGEFGARSVGAQIIVDAREFVDSVRRRLQPFDPQSRRIVLDVAGDALLRAIVDLKDMLDEKTAERARAAFAVINGGRK